MGVETEAHLELINRFGRDPGGEDLVQTFERVMIALEAPNTFLDGEAGFHRVLHRANACQRGQILVGFVNAHSKANVNPKPEFRNPKRSSKSSNSEIRVRKSSLLSPALSSRGGEGEDQKTSPGYGRNTFANA